MRRLIRETIEQRVFGMNRPGHEGRIQTLEKTLAAAGASLPSALARNSGVGSVSGTASPVWTSSFTNTSAIILGPSGLSFQANEIGLYQLFLTLTMVNVPTTITGPAIGTYNGTDAASASIGIGTGNCWYIPTTSIYVLQGYTYFDIDSSWTLPVQFAHSISFGGTYSVSSLYGVCTRIGDPLV